jgi:hypothetical protein
MDISPCFAGMMLYALPDHAQAQIHGSDDLVGSPLQRILAPATRPPWDIADMIFNFAKFQAGTIEVEAVR